MLSSDSQCGCSQQQHEAPTKVVMKRATGRPWVASAKHGSMNQRPRRPWQANKCSPSEDNSPGRVSASWPKDAVVQAGEAYRLAVGVVGMLGSTGMAAGPSGWVAGWVRNGGDAAGSAQGR